MALYDMIRNAQNVSLDDTVARAIDYWRQYHLFSGKSEVETLRAAFITAFYSYCKRRRLRHHELDRMGEDAPDLTGGASLVLRGTR